MEEFLHTIYTWFCTEQNWSMIGSIISFLGDVCLFFVAVYTFRLTIFPKKLLLVGLRENSSAFNGNSLEIMLENRSLCPVVINSVNLIYNSKRIHVFDGQCIIEGFKTQIIKMEPYSYILFNDKIMNFDFLGSEKVSLWIKTTRGSQHIKRMRSLKMIARIKNKKYAKFLPTTVCRNNYHDKLVAQGVKYALTFIDNEKNTHTVFIKESGIMSEYLFWGNSIPEKLLKSESELRAFFNEAFGKYSLSYELVRFGVPLKQTKD
mgnify:CR=1 FL=1